MEGSLCFNSEQKRNIEAQKQGNKRIEQGENSTGCIFNDSVNRCIQHLISATIRPMIPYEICTVSTCKSRPILPHLDLPYTSRAILIRRSGRARDRLAVEVREEASISTRESATAPERVDDAVTPQIRRAGSVGAGVGRGEDAAFDGRQQRRDDVLEDVALGDGHGAGLAQVEGVAGDGVPFVVDLRGGC